MITYTGGTFDLLHVGHLELLRACRDLAGSDGRVVVSLNTDDFVLSYKGRPPVQDYATREEILRACRLVDLVVANVGGPDSSIAIDVVRPDVIVIGDDWKDRDYLGQLGISSAWLAERGLWVEYIPRTRGVSTTAIREGLGDKISLVDLAESAAGVGYESSSDGSAGCVALRHRDRQGATTSGVHLSPRQMWALAEYAVHGDQRQAAACAGMTLQSIKRLLSVAYAKLGVTSSLEAFREIGWLTVR